MFPEELPRALQSFEILQRLGAGGVGQVFLAKSRGGRLVAIKVVADANSDGDFADAFAREASLCARLQHPAIVQVRAFIDDDELTALVFEYVAGVALTRLLRFCASHGVRLPDRAAWHIVERVLTALSYAHSLKDEQMQPTPIVHRDVSPANILVDWNGGVKITDFGIAKMLGVSPATRLGLVKGTLGCMAPEQARGDEVTTRADVYAAALLAWRLATGRVPFARHVKDEYELMRAMRNPRIKPLSALRPDLQEPVLDAVARALLPDPEERTITAAEFAAVVRSHFDVSTGSVELAELLARWKTALERTVKRTSGDGDSSEERVAHTLRYEEVALAFDDDVPPDGPTIQEAALPSDASLLAALPVEFPDISETAHPPASSVPASNPPPPPATLDTLPTIPELAPQSLPGGIDAWSGTPSVTPSSRRTRSSRRPLFVALLALALAVALVFVAVALVR